MHVLDSVLDAVGRTPLVRLHRITSSVRPMMLAKLENLNPGGSLKDRIGLRLIEDAERRGQLRAGGTIVEPTSGNTGHALALAAAVKGYRAVFVMADRQAPEKAALLRAYGAEVVLCPSVPSSSPESYLAVADRLAREIPGAFQPNQYLNPENPNAHYDTTGPEIWEQTDGTIDVIVGGLGTGGTVSGVARFLKEKKPTVLAVGADAVGSIYSGGPPRPYRVEGIGKDFIPATLDLSVIDRIIAVSDRDAFMMSRRLARQEGILAGGSAGSALRAALLVAQELDERTVVVIIVADTGRNYLSRIYSDQWMRENGYLERFGDDRVSDLLVARSPQRPGLVTVTAEETIGCAIDRMHEFGISQLPVTNNGQSLGTKLVGSVQQQSLVERLYRDPFLVAYPVGTAMDNPLPEIAVSAGLEEAFDRLLRGPKALVVVDGESPVGIVTRSDLLASVVQGRYATRGAAPAAVGVPAQG